MCLLLEGAKSRLKYKLPFRDVVSKAPCTPLPVNTAL